MRLLLFFLILCTCVPALMVAQEEAAPAYDRPLVYPNLKDFGGIYEMPEATVLPDRDLKYLLIVDVVSEAEAPDSLAQGLYRLARMVNLFGVAGVPAEQLDIVLAIHGGATFAVMDNDSYRARFGVDNPNLPLLTALVKLGVKPTVCGQSLIGRNIPVADVDATVEVATSMLTTVATYQMRGYQLMKF